MNQPPLTIFSDNGVLKGAIMPEPPPVMASIYQDMFAMNKFEWMHLPDTTDLINSLKTT